MTRMTQLRRFRNDSIYLLSGFPLAVISFSILVSFFALGVSLLITLVGLPIMVITWLLARQFARIERRRITWVSGRAAPEPAYRPRARGGVGALLDAVLDPQAARDFVHGIAIFAVSCVTWTVGIVWAAVAPLTVAWLMAGHTGRAWLYVGTAVVCVLTLPLVVRGLTALQVAFGRRLLTRPQATSTATRRELEITHSG